MYVHGRGTVGSVTSAPSNAGGARRQMLVVLAVLCLLTSVACTGGRPEPHRSRGPSSTTAVRLVHTWLTTADGRTTLSRRPDVSFSTEPVHGPDVLIDDARRYQHFYGTGASITGASATLLDQLRGPGRKRVMSDLFSPQHGIGLSVLRQPLGANDFSRGSYSYDDTRSAKIDPGLAKFSLGSDAAHVLPLVREAISLNPSLAVVASPWTAPGWMKTSGSLVGGTLAPEHAEDYARYLVRTLQAYAAAGVPVHALTVQNEPSYSPPHYAGMTLDVEQQRDLIDNHLAPALAAAGLHTQVWALDDNFDRWQDADALLSSPTTRSHVYGVAFHCYRGAVSALDELRRRHQDVPVAISECSGGDWSTGFAQELRFDAQTLLVRGIRNGASWVVKWNVALDPAGGPTNGGCQNCNGLVTIDPRTGAVQRSPAFYAWGQVGRFVTPGAQVVGSTSHGRGSIETVAFVNPDGSHVVLAFNSGGAKRTFHVTTHGRSFGTSLPPGALATYTW
jgi:glucosylceramidase